MNHNIATTKIKPISYKKRELVGAADIFYVTSLTRISNHLIVPHIRKHVSWGLFAYIMYLEGINHFLLSTSVAELLRLNHAKIKKEEIPFCVLYFHT